MGTSNLQEMKDAAIELMKFTCYSCKQSFCEDDVEEEDGQSVPSPCSAIIRMRNALSANPIRNCDVGTAEEQVRRHTTWCEARANTCLFPKAIKCTSCFARWAQMPYEKEK